ncbi:stage V sporulation protein B [Shimazuella kribbensis]|uniref:stage V sporulation protein B n=1 Tax=Shimazuella kribbensis TaxID=139808 RepID=UPI000428DC60|nr:stage V sporulation protein B [Shimazuella kribbensis]
MSKQGFLYGTIILVGAGFITKILGFVYRIALSRIIGEEGMGLFQMVFPILIFAVVVTTAGVPVAISKLVSEAEARGEEDRIPAILIVSIFIVLFTSVIIAISIFFGASKIAHILLTDGRTIYALLAITPVIPIIAISSIFRGYFQGRQNMSPYAIAQILEQMVRIFTVIFLAQYLLPFGLAYAAAGAMLGMVVGEFVGMIYIYISYRRDKKYVPLHLFRRPKHLRRSIKEILRVSVPVTLSRMIGSFSYALEPIVVAHSLALAGITSSVATALYGRLEGMAIPLIFFPTFITYALTVSLVPAISEAAAQNQPKLIEHRLQQAIRLSLLIGAPCTVFILLLAEPLSVLLYHKKEIAHMIYIIAPVSFIHYLQGPFASVLQGLDKANVAMRNTIIGAVLKIPLIFLLASQPGLGIYGVAIAINIGILLVTGLHFISILKYVTISIHLKPISKLTFSVLVMGAVTFYLIQQEGTPLLQKVLLTSLSSFGIYFICLLIFSLVRKGDVNRIPYVGRWIAKVLPH